MQNKVKTILLILFILITSCNTNDPVCRQLSKKEIIKVLRSRAKVARVYNKRGLYYITRENKRLLGLPKAEVLKMLVDRGYGCKHYVWKTSEWTNLVYPVCQLEIEKELELKHSKLLFYEVK